MTPQDRPKSLLEFDPALKAELKQLENGIGDLPVFGYCTGAKTIADRAAAQSGPDRRVLLGNPTMLNLELGNRGNCRK